MKWYCCINEVGLRGEEPFQMLQVALRSCLRNTGLKPHLVYVGEDQENLRRMEDEGVTVIRHTPSLEEVLRAYYGDEYSRFCGHWLRVDIPDIEMEEEYVLYTDIDVIFLRDFPVDAFKPEFIACAPEHHRGDYSYFNSGTMVINIPACRAVMPQFRELVSNRIQSGEMHPDDHDQVNLNIFFNERWSRLPDEYNWKPYWGKNEDAVIVHFHGPKPKMARDIMEDENLDEIRFDNQVIFARNPQGYRYYLAIYQYLTDNPDTEFTGDRRAHGSKPCSPMGGARHATRQRENKPAPPIQDAALALYYPDMGIFLVGGLKGTGLVVSFQGGGSCSLPLAGDWDGDGQAGVGLYLPNLGTFVLRESLANDHCSRAFIFSPHSLGWMPVSGDWDGDGRHSVGLYDPLDGIFYLSNRLTGGEAELVFRFGPQNSNFLPVAGDWEGRGYYSVGLYDPISSRFLLRPNLNGDESGVIVIDFPLDDTRQALPVAGDWNRSGRHSVGLYQQIARMFHLKVDDGSDGVKCVKLGAFESNAIPLSIALAGY